MKGLDTPVLLSILHGSPRAANLLKGLQGEELATTEINLFELRVLAAEGPRSARKGRDASLDLLRRRITVLPVTAESESRFGTLLGSKARERTYEALIWGTMAAAGCGEWITSQAFSPPRGALPFKVRIV